MRTYPSLRSAVKIVRLNVITLAVKKKAMTVHEVGELVGVKYATAKQYLEELHNNNEVYIVRYERTKAAFRPVYKFGNKPDAVKPERIPHWVYDMKRPKRPYQPRRKQSEKYDTKPRRDVAASWF